MEAEKPLDAEARVALILADLFILGEQMGDALRRQGALTKATLPPAWDQVLFTTVGEALVFVRHGRAWQVTPTDEGWEVSSWLDGELLIDAMPFERDAFPFGLDAW